MMDLATIRAMSREEAAKAARAKRVPLVLEASDIEHWKANPDKPGFRLPSLGDYRPKGFKLVRELFCDTSGFGRSDEPALTVERLAETVKPGYGYAVIESGQFQCYVGEFEVVR